MEGVVQPICTLLDHFLFVPRCEALETLKMALVI